MADFGQPYVDPNGRQSLLDRAPRPSRPASARWKLPSTLRASSSLHSRGTGTAGRPTGCRRGSLPIDVAGGCQDRDVVVPEDDGNDLAGHRAHDPHLASVAGEPTYRRMDGWRRRSASGSSLARFLVPLLIPLFPLPAMIACLVIDAVDQTVFQPWRRTLTSTGYQGYDKALDIYYLTIAYLVDAPQLDQLAASRSAGSCYYYRLVGVVLFERPAMRWLLLLFPNTFEYFFDLYRGGPDPLGPASPERRRSSSASPRSSGSSSSCPRSGGSTSRSWTSPTSSRSASSACRRARRGRTRSPANWWIVVGFLVVVVLLIVLAWWVITRKLPPADRPLTLAADSQQPPLAASGVLRRRPLSPVAWSAAGHHGEGRVRGAHHWRSSG